MDYQEINMDRQDSSRQPLKRKKLWEIDESFKCALIGSCLSRTELRKLSREKVYAIEPGCNDYQLHAQFIRIAGRHDLRGKALHKYLEKKYRAETRKYFLAVTDEEIKALWTADLTEGRLDSAWWAIMTHPLASAELIALVYGEIHMLAHDCIGNFHKKTIQTQTLRSKLSILEEALGSERQSYLREKGRLKKEIADLAVMVKDNARLREENEALRAQIGDLAAARQEKADRAAHEDLYPQPNSELYGRIDALTVALESSKKQHEHAMTNIREMEEQHLALERRIAEQTEQIATLEGMLNQYMAPENRCVTCADQHTGKCPGLDLCGRTVLYVGGLNKMVPHYRQLVENSGGRFMHHDGGKEVSRTLLPKMLISADAVLCPIDCISHDACNCAKKICKRYQKQFILMRSASLSSLAKGLSDIVQ